jgi:hypothetical protein
MTTLPLIMIKTKKAILAKLRTAITANDSAKTKVLSFKFVLNMRRGIRIYDFFYIIDYSAKKIKKKISEIIVISVISGSDRYPKLSIAVRDGH